MSNAMKRQLLTVTLAIALIGFIVGGVTNIRNSNFKIKLQEVELKSNEAKLQELNMQYEQVLKEKTDTDQEKQEHLEKIKELESDRERLERELLSKREKQQVEQEKLASAARRASGTASASAAGGCEQYRHLVAQYSWNVDTMMRAMQLESSCNSNAVGDTSVIGGIYAPSCGLLQVRTLPGRPSCEQLKDPAFNIATAYKIWQSQGYRAWSVLR